VVEVVLDGRMATDRALAMELLPAASTRLIRAVDGFQDDEWSSPSLLPNWTRAHVIAHLALNAEGIARALRGVVASDGDERRTRYDSDEKRDSDIGALATRRPGEIRDRLLGGTTRLQDAMAAIRDDAWDTPLERTPGGRVIKAHAFPTMRLTELEIHHADLGTTYTPASWSTTFAGVLLDSMARRVDPAGPFEVAPLDLPDRRWRFGEDTDGGPDVPVVTGPAGALAWWLTGRPPADTLSCSRGELPSIEGW
jgi:maleylpyruvate isomerase